MSPALLLLIVLYFGIVEGYGGFVVLRATRRARGVIRRRLELIGAGTLLLALTILSAGLTVLLPNAGVLALPLALGAALTYVLGFVPPGPLLRAWQAPVVFGFVRRTSRLVGEAGSRQTAMEIGEH